ncbi:centromere protein M isoform X2 [Crotalus tigris]|uniref:centromere protein M isoform X2 n=1 Tax=Crotalus tigris TaxID=88082 RepID=UPI00192F3000|nr:centromere protein M isoform X2 [Crotalus tigris]
MNVFLVGTNVFQQQLAETLLKERQDLKINIHLAASLPLPVERNHVRPRIDLIVFMINIQSKYSFEEIEASLIHVDANFFLGKVCLLVTGVGRMNKISVDMDAVWKLADRYCSPVLFCELECEKVRTVTAQRLLRMLQICAGHVSGMSSLSFSSLMKCSIEDSSYLA